MSTPRTRKTLITPTLSSEASVTLRNRTPDKTLERPKVRERGGREGERVGGREGGEGERVGGGSVGRRRGEGERGGREGKRGDLVYYHIRE